MIIGSKGTERQVNSFLFFDFWKNYINEGQIQERSINYSKGEVHAEKLSKPETDETQIVHRFRTDRELELECSVWKLMHMQDLILCLKFE